MINSSLEIVKSVYRNLTPENLKLNSQEADDRGTLELITESTTLAIIGLMFLPGVNFNSNIPDGKGSTYQNIIEMLACSNRREMVANKGLRAGIVFNTDELSRFKSPGVVPIDHITGMQLFRGSRQEKSQILTHLKDSDYLNIDKLHGPVSMARLYDTIHDESKPTFPDGRTRDFMSIYFPIDKGTQFDESLLHMTNRNPAGANLLASTISVIKDYLLD